jgi:hypothetical protein
MMHMILKIICYNVLSFFGHFPDDGSPRHGLTSCINFESLANNSPLSAVVTPSHGKSVQGVEIVSSEAKMKQRKAGESVGPVFRTRRHWIEEPKGSSDVEVVCIEDL